jgi:hypothetical protein
MSRPTIGGDVSQPMARQRIVGSQDDDGEEESDMGMDVDTIQELSRTEGLASDPSTNFLVPGIYASKMVEGSWTLTEHLSFDLKINDDYPSSVTVGKLGEVALPLVLADIAGQNKKQTSFDEASGLIKENTWLRNLLISCREKGSFEIIRRLSECLLYTFPVFLRNLFFNPEILQPASSAPLPPLDVALSGPGRP